MSNTKHTPGPWRHAGHDYAQGTHITVYCEQGTNVASVTKSPWTGNKGPSAAKYLEVAEANARLIAAAPELLRVAELAATLNTQTNHIGSGMLAELVEHARAAIAKYSND